MTDRSTRGPKLPDGRRATLRDGYRGPANQPRPALPLRPPPPPSAASSPAPRATHQPCKSERRASGGPRDRDTP